MPVWLLMILLLLAIHRGTRLVITDTFPLIAVPRDAMLTWLVPDDERTMRRLVRTRRAIHYLFTCPWCMSVWVGAGIVALTTNWYDVPAPWLVVAAGSTFTGFLAQLEDRLDN